MQQCAMLKSDGTGNIETRGTQRKQACSSNPVPSNSFFQIVWWNGGGKLASRIRTNHVLKNLLNVKKPHIFIYGEVQSASISLKLDGYLCFLHGSKPFSVDNVRRGIAVFFREEL